MVLFGAIASLGWGLIAEARNSYLQSRLLSHWAADMWFDVRPGRSNTIRFPRWGPYDERMGYTRLPPFIASLTARHFGLTRQARWSPSLERFVDEGGYTIYDEKNRAGLQLFDRDRSVIYDASYPLLAYGDFASIPPLVVDSLLFIEDHRLLDHDNPRHNPAVDWNRFMLAIGGQVAGIVNRRFREGGASTLAT
jgi:membrane peptidoglycan carboxypeptidase